MLKITRVRKPEPIAVFDIKVEETESFMANGILVHNCGEIIECTDKDRTAVCCLSSLNLEYFDEWKNDHQFYRDIAEFLDNVLEYFIKKAPSAIKRAKYSAMRERSIGIGALGFHAYLQKNMIPFEGVMAKSANNRMFSIIEKHLKKVNKELGEERGSPPDLEGSGLRFANMTAIAPNATSSIIMRNTSPSIEPFRANAYRQDTISGSYLNKNRHLDELIKKKCEEDPKIKYDETWSSIISNDGSVQHLKFLDDLEKDTFKTAMEIDQRWIIEHAADRQQYIDQSQSVNLFFRPNANISYVHAVHFLAWQKSMKTLYYCRSEKLSKTDKIAKQIERQIIEELDMSQVADGEVCLACEG